MISRNFFLSFFILLSSLLSQTTASASVLKIREQNTPYPGSTMYVPDDGKDSHPGVIVLHGSEGGSLPYYKLEAQFLAAHGYVALAYCWYNCDKNPITSTYSSLENIELKNTIKVTEWFKKTNEVNNHKVALLGFSRGAEQAVLLASLPDGARFIDALAVHTPSDNVVNGFNWSTMDKRCWICSTPDLACFKNTGDLAFWDFANMRWNPACKDAPKDIRTMTAWQLNGIPFQPNQEIEIETFRKPVFITVGDLDEMWDYQKSVRLADRLKKYTQPVELHIFPSEYHKFRPENENKRRELLLEFLARSL